jgi:hypothetical protein
MANNIIRVSKPERFAVLSHDMLRDTRLSFAARGLLAYLLSLPDSWEIRVSHLIEQSPAGRDAVYSMMKELTAFGYMRRVEKRGASGRILGYENIVSELSENPQPAQPKSPKTRRTHAVQPDTEKPDTAEPDTAKPGTKKELLKEIPTGDEKPMGRSRATTAPAEFSVTPEMAAWARANTPQIDAATETENFLDHHRAKGSAFKDWPAAWRTWMRNAVRFQPRATQSAMNRGGKGLVL